MAQKISVSKSALFQEVSGEMVILDLTTESYFGLDEIGSRIWSLLESGKSLEETNKILLEEYEVEPSQLMSDIKDLLDELVAKGLVEIENQKL